MDRRNLSGWFLVLVSIALAATAASALDAQTAAMAQGVSAGPLIVDLEGMRPGKLPKGFSAALTGKGAPPAWVIKEDPTAPAGPKVVTQTTSDRTSYRFPICIYDAFTGDDLELSVSFKPISGRVDQAAGLVWRYQDANNYYVVRANALEDNVVLYKMEDGKRSDLKSKGAWFFS